MKFGLIKQLQKGKRKGWNVWIVSWYDYGKPTVVTAFDNKETAMKYYRYELGRCCHENVSIDKCPVYSTFTEAPESSAGASEQKLLKEKIYELARNTACNADNKKD